MDLSSLTQLYQEHHKKRRGEDFVYYGAERSAFIQKALGTTPLQVLDIGCRDGKLTSMYMGPHTITGIDVDKEALQRAAKRNIKTIYMSVYDCEWTPIADKTYDAVVVAEVLEHLYHPEKILQKIHKTLKPGGKIIGTVPNAFSLPCRLRLLRGTKAGTPLQDPTHINHFSYKELYSLLQKYFIHVQVSGLTSNKQWLANINTNMFGHDLVFTATAQ